MTIKNDTKTGTILQAEKITKRNSKKLATQYIESLNELKALQQQFIPKQPIILDPYKISSLYQPSYYLSGDFFEYVALDKNRIGIFIIDIVGKGLSASFSTILLKSIFETVIQKEKTPKAIMQNINNKMYHTMELKRHSGCGFFGVLDTKENTLTYCNCGIGIAKIFRKNNIIELCDYGGFMLGAINNVLYTEGTIKLKSNDTLIFATDGLEDVKNESGERIGQEWLKNTILTYLKNKIEGRLVVHQIEHYIQTQIGNKVALEDDISAICIEVNSQRKI